MRRNDIEDALKAAIRTGTYPAGSRIPSRRTLLTTLKVSPITLQAALDHLAEQGYVVPRGRHGTFVADLPPNRTRYALVFADRPGEGPWNRFWSVIHREGLAWRDAQERRFIPYFCSGNDQDSSDRLRLRTDVEEGRLAGILFVTPPWFLDGSPVLSHDIPRVFMGNDPGDAVRFAGSCLSFGEHDGILQRVFAAFREAGCRRVAGLIDLHRTEYERTYLQECQRAGLGSHRNWWIGLTTHQAGAASARSVARLLLDRAPQDRPDGLFIGDDNLVPHATAAIADLELRVPGDLTVIGHANFPNPTPAQVPCGRFGVDAVELLASALDELDRLKAAADPRLVPIRTALRL